MALRSASLLLGLAGLTGLAACGGEPAEVSPPPPAGPAAVAGTYRVQGLTTVVGSEESRSIEGTVVLSQEGGRYTASFSLKTLYPGPDGPLRAEVIGQGEGVVEGRRLEGTAETQIVASRIPGIDSRFTMVPPSYGVRIVSSSLGSIDEDGGLAIEIESRGAEGEEDYRPTRTTMRGQRIDLSP